MVSSVNVLLWLFCETVEPIPLGVSLSRGSFENTNPRQWLTRTVISNITVNEYHNSKTSSTSELLLLNLTNSIKESYRKCH